MEHLGKLHKGLTRLLTTIGGTPNHNRLKNDLHEKVNMDRQPAPNFDSNDHQGQL